MYKTIKAIEPGKHPVKVTQRNWTIKHRDTEHEGPVAFDVDTAGSGSTKLSPIIPLSPSLSLSQSPYSINYKTSASLLSLCMYLYLSFIQLCRSAVFLRVHWQFIYYILWLCRFIFDIDYVCFCISIKKPKHPDFMIHIPPPSTL